MDAQVEKALKKWPNLPHCFGWLALDARGNWRMRDDNAQKKNLPGDKIIQPALIGFINRNYTHDNQGHWYFQNGPQRVYVDLEAAPYIAHTESDADFVLQTGEQLQKIEAVWLSDQGRFWLQGDGKIALLDDRDLTQCLNLLRIADHAVTDTQLMAWLNDSESLLKLTFSWNNSVIEVGHLEESIVSKRFNFIRVPRAVI
jgi:hypothetical protein